MLVRSVRTMRAIFRICGNESQPGLQLVEKLATPLNALSLFSFPFLWFITENKKAG